jgi:hypothetical protein
LSIIAKARIINYDSRIVIHSFIVLATVIMIVNYDCTAITIVNYDCKTFMLQGTDSFFGVVYCLQARKSGAGGETLYLIKKPLGLLLNIKLIRINTPGANTLAYYGTESKFYTAVVASPNENGGKLTSERVFKGSSNSEITYV